MAAITSAMVKELRERTNAGMMDCKKALVNADGDMDKAIDWLREKGLAQAAKKAGRVAAEGAVAQYVDGNVGVIVEINCETDFVAGTDNFKNFCTKIAKHIAVKAPATIDELLAQPFVDDESIIVKDLISETTVATQEKLDVRRFVRYDASGLVSTYIHMGGKVGVMVDIACEPTAAEADAVKEFAHDVCLQIAAAKPEAVRREEVDTSKLEKEKEIQRAKALESGKPEKIVDRIVEGQIEKYYKEVCLVDQLFVKDPDFTISKLMAKVSKEVGTAIDIVRFVRYERGEGIEKRQDDLAAEIAAMTK